MKKIVTVLLVLLTALLGAAGLTACAECSHDFGDWEIVEAPTCTEGGERVHTCTKCGEIETETLGKLGHDWDEEKSHYDGNGTHTLVCSRDASHVETGSCELYDNVVAATCEAGGYTEHVCLLCNHTERDTETDELGHDYADPIPDPDHPGQHISICRHDAAHVITAQCEYKVTTVEPKCETDGFDEHVCNVCNHRFEDNFKDKLEHDWEEEYTPNPDTMTHGRRCKNDPNHVEITPCEFTDHVVEPTCADEGGEGYTEHTCRKCQFYYTDQPTSRLEHKWGAWKQLEGTTEAESRHYRVCELDGTHRQEGDCTFIDETDPAACGKTGKTTHTCLECEYQYEETLEALEHLFGSYLSDGNGHHVRTCTRDGCDESQELPCQYETQSHPATCTEDAYTEQICTEPTCRHTIKTVQEKTALGHDWEENPTYESNGDKLTHTVKCGRGCGEEQSAECTFSERNVGASCSAQGYTEHTCEKCSQTYQDAFLDQLPHTYEDEDENGWKPVDGYSAETHRHYRLCTVCGGGREENDCANCRTETTDATCSLEGHKDTVCDTCKGTLRETIEKEDHTWGLYEPKGESGHTRECTVCHEEETLGTHKMVDATKAPTCNGVGSQDERCELCGYVKDGEDIPALGHDYQDVEWQHDDEHPENHIRKCKTCQEQVSEPCVYSLQTKDATCMSPKVETYTCNACNHVKTVEGEALGCDYGTPVYDGEGDTHTLTCLRENCDNPEGRTVQVSCSFNDVRTPETCTEDAFTTSTCACGNVKIKQEPGTQKGHSYGNNYVKGNNGTHSVNCINCGEPKTELCSYNAGKVTKPTCTQQGYTTKTCTKCSYQLKDTYVQPNGHTWSTGYTSNGSGKHYRVCTVCSTHDTEQTCQFLQEEEVKPTCDAAGYFIKRCKTCSYTSTRTGAARLEHQWKVSAMATEQSHERAHTLICSLCSTTKQEKCRDQLDKTPASCSSPEFHHHVCTVCSSVYDHYEGVKLEHRWGNYRSDGVSSRHSKTCSLCGEETTEACYGSVSKVVRPTCEGGGWTEHICRLCNTTYTTDPKEPTGHRREWNTWYQSMDGKSHFRQCPACGAQESVDCTMNEIAYTAATCLKTGSRTKQCPFCNRSEKETIPAIGHDYPAEWVKSTNGVEHYRLCRRDGCGVRNVKPCVMVPAGDTNVYCKAPSVIGLICRDCGYTNSHATDLVEHKWSDWTYDGDGHHSRYCTRVGCDTKQVDECHVEETSSVLTCTTDESVTRYCTTCDFKDTTVTQSAKGHTWQLSETTDTTHSGQCLVCEETANGPHDFENSNLCSVCKYDGLTYTYNESGFYVVENDNKVSDAEEIVIASKVKGFPVKQIAKNAFIGNETITSIVLPRTLVSIGECAFRSCPNLTSVTFAPLTDTTPEDEKEIALETIGLASFDYCRQLDAFPFAEAKKLKTVGDLAFQYCDKLADLSGIPETVMHIGTHAFGGTKALLDWEKSDSNVFYAGKHLVKVRTTYAGEGGVFTMKQDTISVGAEAFMDCKLITSLVLYPATQFFDKDAFKGCENLASLEYNGSLAQWLAISFGNDYASPMRYVSSFHIAAALDSPQFPENISSIPAGTFRNNTSLKTVVIPANITSIGAQAFEGCVNLTSLTLPDTLTYIGEDAFAGCTALIENPSNWENGVMYLGRHIIMAKNAELPEGGALTIRTDTVTISPRAFKDCTNLTSVNIPKSVLWIGANAFTDCTKLTSATFEGALTEGSEGTVFFSTNTMGAGRWLDNELANTDLAAYYLKSYYPTEWKRIQ